MALIGKHRLALALGVSRPTLDRMLVRHKDLPVERRGGRNQQWLFDQDAVRAFLAAASVAIAPKRPPGTLADAVAGAQREMDALIAVAREGRSDADSIFQLIWLAMKLRRLRAALALPTAAPSGVGSPE
ncbi:MAG TPA: hypothetical protein VGG10_15035 [Rhizomicrobium sp.]|jgi:phage terminase Nu1 subunit (DNA packaging protein)